jgi:putative intracellular protease/amidase
LTNVVPFLLEDELTAKGGHYRKVDDWQAYAVQDGMLITGQNPASSEQTAQRLLDVLRAMV